MGVVRGVDHGARLEHRGMGLPRHWVTWGGVTWGWTMVLACVHGGRHLHKRLPLNGKEHVRWVTHTEVDHTHRGGSHTHGSIA